MTTRAWHYQHDGSTIGPIPEDHLAALLESDEIPSSTPIWTKELDQWYPAEQIENFFPDSPSEPAPPVSPPAATPIQALAQPRQQAYRYPKMWIGIVLTILAFLVLSIGFAFVEEPVPDDIPWFAVGVAFLVLIPTYVYWLICIYKLHSVLRQHTKGKYPITPGQAVGYGFIPFYHLYWMFRWTNQIVDFVNESDPPTRMKKGWPGFWLLFSAFFWKASSALSYLIKYIVGIRLLKRVRMAIERT